MNTSDFLTATMYKVLSHVTDEWTETNNIGRLAGYRAHPQGVQSFLKKLEKIGRVEHLWDHEVGRKYWRLKR